jgi:hypothetical protein
MNFNKLMLTTSPALTLNVIRFLILAIVVLISLVLPEAALAYPAAGGVGG